MLRGRREHSKELATRSKRISDIEIGKDACGVPMVLHDVEHVEHAICQLDAYTLDKLTSSIT